MKSDELLPSILLVDDDPDDVFMTKRLLLKAGVRNGIVALSNGQEALDYLKGVCAAGPRPCLLLLDLKLPRVDGFTVLNWIRQQRPLRGLKVVILSGSDEPRDRQRAHALGADGYLVKHPDPAVLRRFIDGDSPPSRS